MNLTGKHKEWRKVAKKERRRKIRKNLAYERDKVFDNEEYQLLEQMELERILKSNEEENKKWLQAEKRSLEIWEKLQEKKKLLHQEKLEREAKIQLEWEMEQKRIKEEAETLKAIEEENKLKQEKFMKSLDEFLAGDTVDPPQELLVIKESRPGADTCPFFSKTACCRFGDQCSRNHCYPGISRVLLATNFYTHFGLSNSTPNEYDTDIMLEYEDNETYREFKEFFYDVVEEFEKFGKIVEFQVCNNYEKHLRGNTYIEYAELRCAVKAYQALHTRWYGGRQLSLQFCNIRSWKNAICGLYLRKRCPKGRACNFLHVFRNPINFRSYHVQDKRESERSMRTPVTSRSWRWSESPEVEIPRKSRRLKDYDRKERRHRERDREKYREKQFKHRDRSRERTEESKRYDSQSKENISRRSKYYSDESP